MHPTTRVHLPRSLHRLPPRRPACAPRPAISGPCCWRGCSSRCRSPARTAARIGASSRNVADAAPVERILNHIGEPPRPPPITPARLRGAAQSCSAWVPARAIHGSGVRCLSAAHPPPLGAMLRNRYRTGISSDSPSLSWNSTSASPGNRLLPSEMVQPLPVSRTCSLPPQSPPALGKARSCTARAVPQALMGLDRSSSPRLTSPFNRP